MNHITVYHVDGDKLGERVFDGHPLPDDCFLLGDTLLYVVSRRWTNDGRLELVTNTEPKDKE